MDDPAELSAVLATIWLDNARDRSAGEYIYQFDQLIAGLGIRYYAEYCGTRHWLKFKVLVAAEYAESVNMIVTQLNMR